MKTRSNDIIPNAPFKYNSDTNTFKFTTNILAFADVEIDAYNNYYILANDNFVNVTSVTDRVETL